MKKSLATLLLALAMVVPAFATDTGYITDSMSEALWGCDTVVIESNHDVRMLENGDYPAESARMEGVMEMIRSIRNLRAGMNVQPSHKAHLFVRPAAGWQNAFDGTEVYFSRLASVSSLSLIGKDEQITGKTVSAVCGAGEYFIPLGELVDFEKEKARLNKERDGLLKEIARAEAKLGNPGFVSKAPAQLVAAEKEKLEKNRQMLSALEARIAELG